MPSAPSALLLLELMADGENDNTWGDITNTNLQLLEQAIAGLTSIVVGDADITLTDTDYASDQARNLCVQLTGSLTADIIVTVPQRTKFYLIDDQSTANGYTITVTSGAAGGTNVDTINGGVGAFFCDGTNIYLLSAGGNTNASFLGGYQASNFAQLVQRYSDYPTDSDPIQQQWVGGNAQAYVVIEYGATSTLNCQLGNNFYLTLGNSSTTLDFENPADGQTINLLLVQDSIGGRLATFPENIFFEGGTPTLASSAYDASQIVLTYSSALESWVGYANTDFSAGATSQYTITQSLVDTNLYGLLGKPEGSTIYVTVASGVTLRSTSTQNGAIDMSGFSDEQTINLTNLGYIIGCGGYGGDGGEMVYIPSAFATARGGKPGGPGGPAISNLAASTCTLSITNSLGYIWGGGGGGGGGGACAGDGVKSVANGGGGGGGAGGGLPGHGGTGNGSNDSSANGSDGAQGIALGYSSYYATAASGGDGDGSGTNSYGAGGDGGAYGVAGDDGSAASSAGGIDPLPKGSGGAAGYAILSNGMTVAFVNGSSSPNVAGTVG